MKKIEVRLPKQLYLAMIRDLQRPHAFAAERVGFVWGQWEPDAGNVGLVLLAEYRPLEEGRYIDDRSVGVRIDAEAIRSAMQLALDGEEFGRCVFHVHLHEFKGRAVPSRTDSMEIPPMVTSISRVSPDVPHGFLILSLDSLSAWVLPPGETRFAETDCFVSGAPSILTLGGKK